MAKCVRRNIDVLCYCFFQVLFGVVIATHIADASNLFIVSVDNSYLNHEDLHRSLYHVQKRSPESPIKKASDVLEKKFPPKDIPKLDLGHLKSAIKNATDEKIAVKNNSSDSYTVVSSSANDTHSILATSPPLNVLNTTSTSVSLTNTTNTTTTATLPPPISTSASKVSSTTVTTPFPDVLPTKPADITNTTYDHHIYYNSTIYLESDKAMGFWVDFDKLPQDRVVVHRMLSDSHRRAAIVTLTFDFPFYGHPLRNITIATGGFVYMGDYMHSWLAATQYIAPLMANFDTSMSDESTVRYFDNGTAFVIEWHEVSLQDKMIGGTFTFQTTLLGNGNIVFVYERIPVSVTDIGDDVHPVKVGLSDAYVIDKVIYFLRRKTIYEYHRIDMKKEEIGNHTAIYFTALTTCLSFQNCSSCMSADVGLNCVWCEPAKRCSDGLDRLRQDWLQYKCDVNRSSVDCSVLPGPDAKADPNPYVQPLTVSEDSSSMGTGTVVAILLIVSIVIGGLMWVGYAYRNPHTSSGQLLIRYRPTQWRFRSGEARYTAASVHM